MDYRALANQELERQPFPTVQHEFRIFISEEAFDRICESSDKSREVGGILVGNVFQDDSGPYVQVDTVIEALHADERGTDVTLTHATWSHIHQQMDSVHTGKRIVGWYHTHPGFGIFLSDQDRFIHESFFDLPFQVALVYDPVSYEHGVFMWRENKPWRARQYWIGPTPHTWDGPREAVPRELPKPAAEAERSLAAAKSAPTVEPSAYQLITNSWALTVGALGLFLGVLVGQWMINANAKAEVRAQLGEARVQGAKEAINGLNNDLLNVLRRTIGEDSAGTALSDGLSRVNQAIEEMKPLAATTPQVQTALQSLNAAQALLQRSRDDRQLAEKMILELQRATGHAPSGAEAEITEQRQALAGLCAEFAKDAAQSGNKDRVLKLLTVAANLDRAHYDLYQQQYKSLVPDGGDLPRRGEDSAEPKTEGGAAPTAATGAPQPAQPPKATPKR
ncbi:MAG TPA: hypothetical protein VKA60_26205 [Blastocatellia bacterium]|nr:hypothetical protein [Blastocatellia bacterium]